MYAIEVVGTRFGAVELVFVDRRELMIAQCVVDHHRNEVPVRVANLSPEPIKLARGYFIGEVHDVDRLV